MLMWEVLLCMCCLCWLMGEAVWVNGFMEWSQAENTDKDVGRECRARVFLLCTYLARYEFSVSAVKSVACCSASLPCQTVITQKW